MINDVSDDRSFGDAVQAYAPPAGPRPKLPTGFTSGEACANYEQALTVWRERVIRRAEFMRAVGSRAALFCDVREALRIRRNVA